MSKSRMRRAVCFDTTPVIWGVRGDADGADHKMIGITKKYIKHLSDAGFAIMIPAPVIAEYFVGATATQFHEREVLKRGFEIPDFDLRCAELAATLQRGGNVDIIRQEYGTPKQNIRIDSFIVAIAIVNEAEKIITNNKLEFEILAGGRIPIETVPVIPEQASLFDPDARDE